MILLGLVLFAFGHYLLGVEISNANDEIPITLNDEFFKVAIDYFDIDPDEYRLVVRGEVNNPLSLSLDEIKALPVTSWIVRLTCVEYLLGRTERTGVANWTGVKLSTVLELAEIDHNKTVDISFHTPDLSSTGYSTSLKPEEAYWNDTILAYEMNEVPLPKDHGFPLRLVVPRMFGYKWIKWVAYINATDFNYQGFWETRGYADSHYVDVIDLPVYYPLTAEGEGPTSDSDIAPTAKKDSSGFGFQLAFFAALALLTLSRSRKKKGTEDFRKNKS
ncbi:MAG: molybdopterin-dependent oxidoreductase [Candidatus Heimdallarchaeota archaeon]